MRLLLRELPRVWPDFLALRVERDDFELELLDLRAMRNKANIVERVTLIYPVKVRRL